MKKITKILALFMTAIVLMSSFSIMSGAISSKSSAKELLDYYENCIITTSAKEDVVKANEVYKVRSTANYSSLQGEDLEATKEENETFGYGDGTWQEDIDTGTYYFTFDDMTHPRPEYVYELDRGGIRSIQFHDQWVTDGFLPVIPSHCEAALHAFVGSRPLVTLKEMNTLDSLTDILVEQIRNAMEIGSITDEMQLGDVLISWNIEFTGADGCGNEFVFSAENEMLTYSLDLTMEIIP